MLKIRSFLRLIKDSIRNFAIKTIKRYNRHMAVTAYALSAIILVFYFGNLAGFKVNPKEVKADAATFEVTDRDYEETNPSESFNSEIKEYALNSPDHNILLDLTTKTEDMASNKGNDVLDGKIYPFGQLSISPAVVHYNDVITSMAILTTQQSQQLAKVEKSVLTINPAQENTKLLTTDDVKNVNDKRDDYQETDNKKVDNNKVDRKKVDHKKSDSKKATDKKDQEKKPQAQETLAKANSSVPTSLKMVLNKKMIKTLSEDEINVLCRIVEAEATGEDVYGKILVANVVLNRMNDSEFPDTVTEVVFQKVGSSYQFSPTKDGRYYDVKVTKTTKEAVNRALAGEDYSKGALYFFARKLTSEKKASWFDQSLRKVVQYGCHEFYANK